MNDFYGSDKERLEDETTGKNMAVLNDMFKNSLNVDDKLDSITNTEEVETLFDPLEQTGEINNVDLETLREYSRKIHNLMDEPSEAPSQSKSPSQEYGGKQKTLTTKPVNKFEQKYGEDVSQILSAFVSCSILALVTAGIGVSWLLYILMHI